MYQCGYPAGLNGPNRIKPTIVSVHFRRVRGAVHVMFFDHSQRFIGWRRRRPLAAGGAVISMPPCFVYSESLLWRQAYTRAVHRHSAPLRSSRKSFYNVYLDYCEYSIQVIVSDEAQLKKLYCIL
jgi:hypothetical protein